MKRPWARNSASRSCRLLSPTMTDFPPPRLMPITADLYVIPRASRSASVMASSVEAYCQKRVPPSAGPSVVSWIAMIPKYPQLGSWDSSTCSCPSARIWARMSIEAPLMQVVGREG